MDNKLKSELAWLKLQINSHYGTKEISTSGTFKRISETSSRWCSKHFVRGSIVVDPCGISSALTMEITPYGYFDSVVRLKV